MKPYSYLLHGKPTCPICLEHIRAASPMSKPWTLRQKNALQQAREDIDTALECIGAQNEAEPTMQTVSDAITFLESAAGELLDLFRLLEADTGDLLEANTEDDEP